MRALFSTLLIFAVACGVQENKTAPSATPSDAGTSAAPATKTAPASTAATASTGSAPAAAKVPAGDSKQIVLNISGMS